jgi:N4-(beta-N-acetylglucosaminyl)-L-asparaginase
MAKTIQRREFVRSGTAVGLLAVTYSGAIPSRPIFMVPGPIEPVVIAAPNGFYYKNGGKFTCIEKACSMIISGSDVLDALIAGVNLPELDPEEDSVGYGGLPNADDEETKG